MPTLKTNPHLRLPVAVECYLGRVPLALAEWDAMYNGNDDHYLLCGASALNVVLGALVLSNAAPPSTILDFGAGAGRVTRWFRAAFPKATLYTCDLRAPDMQFNAETFSARTWISATDIGRLEAPDRFDLIWLGSVATHLSASNTERLLDKMLEWTRDDGLIAMSLHGRYAALRQSELGFAYIQARLWPAIVAGYEQDGYGYADYPGREGYGISLNKPSWIAALIERRPGTRMITLSEKAWDHHHDVVVVQKRSL